MSTTVMKFMSSTSISDSLNSIHDRQLTSMIKDVGELQMAVTAIMEDYPEVLYWANQTYLENPIFVAKYLLNSKETAKNKGLRP